MAVTRLGDPTNFFSEWISVGEHRILLEESDCAPKVMTRRIAMLAVWQLEAVGFKYLPVRVVRVYADRGEYTVTMAVTELDKDAATLAADDVQAAIEAFYDGISIVVDCVVAPEMPACEPSSYTERLTAFALETVN